jgi:type II secretion system protein I
MWIKKIFSNNKKGPEGFTLLEVIIAMAIMAIAFAAILAVEGGAINASARANQLNTVAMLARNQMVETEYKLEGKSFDEIPKEEKGEFDPPYKDFKWKRTVKELEFPNIGAGLGGSGQAGGSSGDSGNTQMGELISKMIKRFFSKAIREVTLTITWKRGKGEQNYSLSTYWVDLNYRFQLSE